jgi:hypothetical protein
LEELVVLYMRYATLQKRLIRIQAELDNVRELIKQKGVL